MTPELLAETEIIKFLLIGFAGGILVTGMFWWADRDDLRRIIECKEAVIARIKRVLKNKILWMG